MQSQPSCCACVYCALYRTDSVVPRGCVYVYMVVIVDTIMELGARTWALIMAVGMCCYLVFRLYTVPGANCNMQFDFGQSKTAARYPTWSNQRQDNSSNLMGPLEPMEPSNSNCSKDKDDKPKVFPNKDYTLPKPKFFPCYYGSEDVFAEYARDSVTPRLVFYHKRTPNKPCGVMKLSCRLRANVDEIWLYDRGTGSKRWPSLDTAFGEVISHNIQMLSKYSARAAIPGGSVVINNASKILKTDEAAKLPLSCWWKQDSLMGYAMEYAKVKGGGEVTSATVRKNSDSTYALATMWIIDSASLNTDRGSKNILRNSKGEPVPMDLEQWFPQGEHWECSSQKNAINQSIIEYANRPRLLKKLAPCSVAFKVLLDGAIKILKELYSGEELSVKLKRSLSSEPGIQFLLYEGQSHSKLRPVYCCENESTAGKYRRRRCYICETNSQFAEVFQRPLAESCKIKYQNLHPLDILVQEVTSRIGLVKSTLGSLHRECTRRNLVPR